MEKLKCQTMLFKESLLLLILSRFVSSQAEDVAFTYNGFQGVDMKLDGLAHITDSGLLTLANNSLQHTSHAFYPHPIHFRNSSTGTALSFSTTFVFAMVSELTTIGGPGIMFVLAPSLEFPGAIPGNYFGLFNAANIGNSSNHLIGVELDTVQNEEFNDINSNHVGIDINDLKSVEAAPASYFRDRENHDQCLNLSLISGDPMQLWVEYDSTKNQLNVTLSPITIPKPTIPLLSLNIDLSLTIVDPMFVGFASSSTAILASHYVLGWSFKMNGQAKDLSLSLLPKLPDRPKTGFSVSIIVFLVTGAGLLVISIFIIIQCIVRRKRRFAEVLEDWELEYGAYRFKYKDLYIATKGFNEKELLGIGGFGKVYKGILPTTEQEVAVKRVSYDSSQGMKEFIAEIMSIGRLQHRNIVTLLGYCRGRDGELLLVYEFMPNGSLDKYLFDQSATKTTLIWKRRLQIIKGIASALQYLHEEWEQVVVHRDVKSSNVMLDRDLNGRLGDFGLARLYDHGGNPETTRVVGTFGYLAPEVFRNSKANPSADVFAFGIFLLEVVCGRRPIEPQASEDCIVLVEWVNSCLNKGVILETVDSKLEMNYEVEEIELVLKLGLLCSHPIPTARPCMRQVVRYLDGLVPLPEQPSLCGSFSVPSEITMTPMSSSILIADSLLLGGR